MSFTSAEMANLDKSQTYTVLGDVYFWNDPSNSWMSDTCPFMINHERMEYYVMKTKQARAAKEEAV